MECRDARETVMTNRMPRSLYRRMQQLEDRLVPGGEPLIIEVQFISAVDKSIVGGFQATVDQGPGTAKRSRAGVRSYR